MSEPGLLRPGRAEGRGKPWGLSGGEQSIPLLPCAPKRAWGAGPGRGTPGQELKDHLSLRADAVPSLRDGGRIFSETHNRLWSSL